MRVFLSYAREESSIADHVAAALRLEGHTVFFDRYTIASGEAFNQKIRKEIRRAAFFIFLISPNAVAPDSYARTELDIAEAEWPSPQGRIIPVMVVPTRWDTVPGVLRALSAIEGGENVVARVTLAIDNAGRARRKGWLRFAVGGVLASGGVVFTAHALLEYLRAGPSAVARDGPVLKLAEGHSKDGGPTPGAEPPGSAGTSRSTSADGGIVTAAASSPIPGDALGVENWAGMSGHASPKTRARHDESAWPLGPDATLKMVRITGTDTADIRLDFWIGQTEVTQAEWRAVGAEVPGKCGDYCGPSYPVDQLSSGIAIAFTNALSKRLGLGECYRDVRGTWDWLRDCTGFRLPTKEEWEVAANIAAATEDLLPPKYPFRKQPSPGTYFCDKGNYAPSADCKDRFPGLATVRQYPANRWGLYDTFGNVGEYVWEEDSGRVSQRGGSYQSGPDQAVFVRGGDDGGRDAPKASLVPLGYKGIGLRVARSARVAR